MASASYDAALARLLAHEGGYTNHPSDPGGPTKFGITIHDYRKHVKPGADAADVRAMTLDQAKAIYRTQYWDAQRCDELPAGVDYAVFDYGVNSGIGRSGRVLRRVLGLDSTSHAVTDAVIVAANARKPADLIAAICDERIAFLKRLRTWPVFGAGWGRRVAEVRAAALAMAKAASGRGAATRDAKAKPIVAGGIAAAGAVAAQQAHSAGVRPALVITIVVLAVAAAWAGWWWSRRTKRQQEGLT